MSNRKLTEITVMTEEHGDCEMLAVGISEFDINKFRIYIKSSPYVDEDWKDVCYLDKTQAKELVFALNAMIERVEDE